MVLFLFYDDLYFLIPALIAQIFNTAAELVISKVTTTNKVNADIYAETVNFEVKISKSPK